MSEAKNCLKVGIAGFGVIGKSVGRALQRGMDGFTLEAVTSGNLSRARDALAEMEAHANVVPPEELARLCDVIVECAPTEAFLSIVEPALRMGRTVVTVSASALIENMHVVDLAKQHGGRILLATGALLGFDAVRAAAEGNIFSVDMVTRKPPRALIGAPYLKQHNIEIGNLTAPLKVFEGSAREGAAGFPANVNVAAALALAGIGADRTRLQVWADPTIERNRHTISVDADSARFEMTIENVPTPEKPGTGKLTPLSVIAAVKSLTSVLRVGS
ncbi:MAG TPA: aspartate dehydrogenase [Candidatus Baltobacteraceae bacterium]|jgi:aspartate dehydrogenase|nr:aspartate dehydrogenase [Candidatus Baltobacteraceae bacterium]